MKKVILLGDSIRIGYQPFVVEKLKGWADVWGPEENCRHSRTLLEGLQAWAIDRPADLIHVNCGLHDMALFAEAGGDMSVVPDVDNQVPFDEYRANVRKILSTLHEQTSATIIWRSTTPSLLDRQIAIGKNPKRTPQDVDKYNDAAREIAQRLGVQIHDLYHEVLEMDPQRVMSADGIHYTPEGYAELGDAVARRIREVVAAA